MAKIQLKSHNISDRDAQNVVALLKSFGIQSQILESGAPVQLLDIIPLLDNRTTNVVHRIPMVAQMSLDCFCQLYDKNSFMKIKGAGLKSYTVLKGVINAYGYDWR